ncbi:serine protease [Vibrio cholerae]|nr:serine protease [Vibrio cholerae]
MDNRYSVLSTLSIDEQEEICKKLCGFFSPLNVRKMREELSLPLKEGVIEPLCLMDFFKFWKNLDVDYWPKMQRVREVVELLKSKSILQSRGGVDLNERFLFFKELTDREAKGFLWLGKILGEAYIGHQIEKDIAYIEGETPLGDISVGTGTLISENVVLTCAHVIDDMTVTTVKINGRNLEIDNCKSHKIVDVGLIFLKESTVQQVPDLGFRDSMMLEPLVIAGYPLIPRSLEPCFTMQTGQVCGHIKKTMDGYAMDLFSAIARPGNSGGPVIGIDGCIIGIVTRSLERQQESTDAMAVIPFFAAVPSKVISECVEEITEGELKLQWETYA